MPCPGITPSVKPCGFASSLGEGASGETGDFAIQPATLPPCQRPHLRGGWLRPTGADWGSFSRHPLSHGLRRASSPKGTPMALPQSFPLPRKPSPWGRWIAAKRQDGRGNAAVYRCAPPVKRQCWKIRRFSSIANLKIYFPLNMARAQRRPF